MFDIGFSELLLVMVIGLVVLGPERLPVAVKTIADWIKSLRSLATSVQNELSREFKLQKLQDSLKKAEQDIHSLQDELKDTAESMEYSYHSEVSIDTPHRSHDPLASDPEAIYDDIVADEEVVMQTKTPTVETPIENNTPHQSAELNQTLPPGKSRGEH